MTTQYGYSLYGFLYQLPQSSLRFLVLRMLPLIHGSGLFLLDLWIYALLKFLEDSLHAEPSVSKFQENKTIARDYSHHLLHPMVRPLDMKSKHESNKLECD